jgi:hypothetical protein
VDGAADCAWQDVARLTALFRARNATTYDVPQTWQDPIACDDRVEELGGFLGPYYTFGPSR